MKTINPQSPHWQTGCQDLEMIEYEDQILLAFDSDLRRAKTILDVGAGAGPVSHRLFPNHPDRTVTRLDLHPNPEQEISLFDLRTDPLPHQADIVFARRVISNLPLGERRAAIQKLLDARADGGVLILIDTWGPARFNVDRLRQEYGIPPLPPIGHGVAPLAPEDLPSPPRYLYPIATSYYLWTRVFYPIIRGGECPYDSPTIRNIYPLLNIPNHLDYGVHRLMAWRK